MSKLFSAFSLVDESVSTIAINNPAAYMDDSYFIEALDFLTGIQKAQSCATAKLYKTISESSTDRIAVQEGFSEFFGTIKGFIKKIIDFIKKLAAKFWVRINSMFLRDKYIEKNKGELAKFSTKHEFDIKGYTYTFTDTVPSTTQLMTLAQSIADFKVDSGGAKTYEDLKKSYDAFMDTKKSSSYLDDKRKDCISAKSNIDESDFKDELFKVFRNGDLSKSSITVNSNVVVEALAFFTNFEKLKNQTQRYSDNMEKEYRNIQKSLEKVQTKAIGDSKEVDISDFVDNVDVTADKIALYDLFMKAKSQEIQEISNIHVMAFSTKLDAIKEDFTQSKGILYGAFKKILAKNESVSYADDEDDRSISDLEDDDDIDDGYDPDDADVELDIDCIPDYDFREEE